MRRRKEKERDARKIDPHQFFGRGLLIAVGMIFLAATGPVAAGAVSGQDETRLHNAVSPDGSREIYHSHYDPYSSEPAVFSVAETGTGRVLRVITIPSADVGRFVHSVEWLNERFVLVRGEAIYVVILDAIAGLPAATFHGANVAVAAEGTHLAFRLPRLPLYGPRPPLATDYVGLAWRAEQGSATDPENGWRTAVIYPRSAPLASLKSEQAAAPDQQHHLEGPFAWSEDGRKLAFAEHHGDSRWLVVLELPAETAASRALRWALAEPAVQVSDLDWLAGQDAVRVFQGDREIGQLIELRDRDR